MELLLGSQWTKIAFVTMKQIAKKWSSNVSVIAALRSRRTTFRMILQCAKNLTCPSLISPSRLHPPNPASQHQLIYLLNLRPKEILAFVYQVVLRKQNLMKDMGSRKIVNQLNHKTSQRHLNLVNWFSKVQLQTQFSSRTTSVVFYSCMLLL